MTLKGHEKSVYDVAFICGTHLLITGSGDKSLWVGEPLLGHNATVSRVAASPDGHWIVSGGGNRSILVWEVATDKTDLKRVPISFKGHEDGIWGVIFAPDSETFASASWDKMLCVWKREMGIIVLAPLNVGSWANSVSYSPDGKKLAAGTNNHIIIWNTKTGEELLKIEQQAVRVAFTPDGLRLISGNHKDIQILGATTGAQDIIKQFDPHSKCFHSLAIAPNGTKFATTSFNTRFFDLTTFEPISEPLEHPGIVWNLAFSEDSQLIATGCANNLVHTWTVPLSESEKELQQKTIAGTQPLPRRAPIQTSRFFNDFDPSTSLTLSPELRQQYDNAERAIQETIKAQLNNAPHCLLNTFTGRLCDGEAQINAFKMSTEYKELLSSTLVHVDLRMERIKDVVETYFCCVMLLHRWEEKEPLLHDIQDKVVHELIPVGGIMKLQSFCKTVRAAGYRWGWIDMCCIDQTNNVKLQKLLNSIFVLYHTSALMMVYLSDVLPSSKPGTLARSTWNTQGWTVLEFLAPKVIHFYQNDWTPYLNDHSPNHKQSVAIMQELEDSMGIDAKTLVTFSPGMINPREKLQWVSTRVTTVQEDITYSLFGIFGAHLPVMYGEKKQNTLRRLLQEVVAWLGDISTLDWVGQSSKFNSCLPAGITSYKAPPYTPPFLSEGDIQTSISLLRQTVAVYLALKIYALLDNLNAPHFANCRLQLHCITFHVTAVTQRPIEHKETYFMYEVKADGLCDLQITMEDLLHMDVFTPPGSPGEEGPVDPESSKHAIQLFSAFLLAQQCSGEYKRIASDHMDYVHEIL
ncbi:WD40 repeat-like protein [Suillus weaverae]|nr:WD40 repeat-like protein [Suillus weaverae]